MPIKGDIVTFADPDSPEFKMSYACMAGQLPAMRQFLESGVDVNHMDDAGFTFLKHAAGNQQLEAVALLIEAGADPNLGAPLRGALEEHQFETADLLVAAGAHLNPVIKGDLMMSQARFWRNSTDESLLWLIAQGADFNQVHDGGVSALQLARKRHLRGDLSIRMLAVIEAKALKQR